MPSLLDNFTDSNAQVVQTPQAASLLDSFHDGAETHVEEAPGLDGQAVLEGFGQTASLGYLPQMQAVAGKGIDAVSKLAGYFGIGPNSVDEDLKQQGFQLPENDSYVQLRDKNIERQEKQSKESPVSSALGKFAGIAATAPLMAGRTAQAAGVAGRALQGARSGAAMGALYNPGDIKGELDPIQLDRRIENSGSGAAVGGVLGAVGGLISKGSQKQRMVDRVKDSANLSPSVKAEIDQALSAVNQNEIAPRAQALREYLTGKDVEVNLNLIKDTFPNLAKQLEGRADQMGRVSLRGNQALRLRRALDSAANYSNRGAFDPTAAARSQTAKQGADVIREKLSQLGPEVGELNAGMANAINKSKALARSSNRAPISSITAKAGSDKASLIDAIDKMAGSSLEQTAQEIKNAQGVLLNPTNLIKPLEMPNEIRKLLARGLFKTSDLVERSAPEGSKEALLEALFETKR